MSLAGLESLPESVENGAFEIAQPGEAEGLDGANHGGIGRVGQIAEHRRRARQRDLAIFIDEPRDAAAGDAKPGVGGAQQPIKLAVGAHRRRRIQRNTPTLKTTVPPDCVAAKSTLPVSCSTCYHVSPASAASFAPREKAKSLHTVALPLEIN